MSRAGLAGVRAEHGIVQPRAGVVAIDVEVVVGGLAGVDGLQVEAVGGVLSSGDERSGRDSRGQEGDGGEKVHYYRVGYIIEGNILKKEGLEERLKNVVRMMAG